MQVLDVLSANAEMGDGLLGWVIVGCTFESVSGEAASVFVVFLNISKEAVRVRGVIVCSIC
jgi:hypothetical protein